MTDIQKDMLGDKEAQERVAERGELLPCPFCGNEFPTIVETSGYGVRICCPMCETKFTRDFYETGRGRLGRERTIEAWNTRPALLTPEQIKRLEILE